MMLNNVEHTTLFNGAVTVWQPLQGYRFAVDSLLLAAFTPANSKQTVLDLGIGVGAASLALAFQHSDIIVHGIDIQADVLEIARRNIEANHWPNRFELFGGNLKNRLIKGHSYDHVIMNPPYFERHTYTNSLYQHKTISNGEGDTSLKDWISEGHRALKSRGYITIIHTARRLDHLLELLTFNFGGIEIFPILSKQGVPAKRILVRARKAVKSPLTLHSGLVLHNEDGSFTSEALSIIQDGQKIVLI